MDNSTGHAILPQILNKGNKKIFKFSSQSVSPVINHKTILQCRQQEMDNEINDKITNGTFSKIMMPYIRFTKGYKFLHRMLESGQS